MSATKKLRAGLAVAALIVTSFAAPAVARADEYCGSSSYCDSGSGGYSSYDCGSSCYSGGYSSGGYSGSSYCGSGGYSSGGYCGSSGGYSSGGYSSGGMSTGQIVGLVDTGIKALGTIFGSMKSTGTVKTGVTTGVNVNTGVSNNSTVKIIKEIKSGDSSSNPTTTVVSDQTPTEIIRVISPTKRVLADTGVNS